METLFIFLVKSSGLIGMFYLAYFVLLRKETFFNSNRWFLLAGLITSVILPLVVFTKIVWVDPIANNFDWSKIPVTTSVENNDLVINWYLVFGIVYGFGIVVFLIKFALDFYSLSKILKGKTIQQQADFKFIDITENVAPFSYFNYIVFNSSLYSATELKNILEHEKVHSSQNHTTDVLISRLFCIVFWFNPLMWLYTKAIIQNLEFIADSEATKNSSDKKAYQLTLLKITTQENCVAITNHFYQSLIKKRIVMLNKNQSNKRNSWKYALVFPLLVAFVFFFQVKVVAQEKVASKQETETKTNFNDINSFKSEDDLDPLQKGKEIYIIDSNAKQKQVDKINSNKIENLNVIKKSDNSNPIIKTNKQSEKTIIVINGERTKTTFEELRKTDPNLIESMTVWKGEKAIEKYGKEGKNGAIEIITKDYKEKTEKDTKKPIIIINGRRTETTPEELDKMDPNLIQSMNVLKGKNAIEKYSKEGENGVIEIITKQNIDLLKSSSKNLQSKKEEIEIRKEEIQSRKNEIQTRKDEIQIRKNGVQAKKDAIQAKIDAKQALKDAEQAKKDATQYKRANK